MGVTDDELHFRLRDRSQRFWVTGQDLLDNMLFREAADRIKQLVATNEQLVRDNKSLTGAQKSLIETLRESGCKRKETEVKLTKAVNVLQELVTCVDDGCYCSELRVAAVVDDAIATLVEIKGET